jgi:hypothetical protein
MIAARNHRRPSRPEARGRFGETRGTPPTDRIIVFLTVSEPPPSRCRNDDSNPPWTCRSNTPSALSKLAPSPVRSVACNYDNAAAETINGPYAAEVIRRRGPWRLFEAAEFATLDGVGWFNHRCLIEPISNIPSAKLNNDIMPCRNSPKSPPDLIRSTAGTRGAIQPDHSERLLGAPSHVTHLFI